MFWWNWVENVTFDIKNHMQQLSQIQCNLVFKTCLLISLIISFKVFFVVTCFEMTGCWFASPVRFLSTGWVVVGLLGNLAQLLYNEPSLMVACYFSAPRCYKCLIVSINESCSFLVAIFWPLCLYPTPSPWTPTISTIDCGW